MMVLNIDLKCMFDPEKKKITIGLRKKDTTENGETENRFLISETTSCQYFYLFLPRVAFYDRKLRNML
jgi:hypothetical protein